MQIHERTAAILVLALFLLPAIVACDENPLTKNREPSYADCLRSGVSGSHNLSVSDIRELCAEASGVKKPLPTTNARGWKLHIDANGNRAYMSPDGKSFEEVK